MFLIRTAKSVWWDELQDNELQSELDCSLQQKLGQSSLGQMISTFFKEFLSLRDV